MDEGWVELLLAIDIRFEDNTVLIGYYDYLGTSHKEAIRPFFGKLAMRRII